MTTTPKLVILFAFLGLAFYVYAFNSPIPYVEEQMHLLPLVQKYYDGHLALMDFFAADHCDHWHVVAYAVLLPGVLYTHWNTAYPAILALCLAAASLAAVAHFVTDEGRRSACRVSAAAVPVAALLLFSIDPFENWIMNWQICFLTTTFGMLAGAALLCRSAFTIPSLWCAVAGGLLATYSYSAALTFWPIGLVILMWRPYPTRRRRVTVLLLWCAVSCAVAGHFYFGVMLAKAVPAKASLSFSKLLHLAVYVPTYFGAPLSRFTQKGWIIAAVGSLGILLFLVLLCRWGRRSLAFTPILAFCLFLASLAAGSALLTGWGRVEFGLRQAATPRYITFGNYFWIGLVLLLCLQLKSGRPAGHKTVPVPGAVLVLSAVIVLKCINQIYFVPEARQYYQSFALAYKSIQSLYPQQSKRPGGLDAIGCEGDQCDANLELLYKYQLNMFRKPGS